MGGWNQGSCEASKSGRLGESGKKTWKPLSGDWLRKAPTFHVTFEIGDIAVNENRHTMYDLGFGHGEGFRDGAATKGQLFRLKYIRELMDHAGFAWEEWFTFTGEYAECFKRTLAELSDELEVDSGKDYSPLYPPGDRLYLVVFDVALDSTDDKRQQSRDFWSQFEGSDLDDADYVQGFADGALHC
jgi:hypothetical protein